MHSAFSSLALVFAQQANPHVIDSVRVDQTAPLSGPDFRLISTAAGHREMRGRDLSCYQILVTKRVSVTGRGDGLTTVSFLGIREELPAAKDGEIALGFGEPNPRCPDRTFEMNENGRVVRVIYARH